MIIAIAITLVLGLLIGFAVGSCIETRAQSQRRSLEYWQGFNKGWDARAAMRRDFLEQAYGNRLVKHGGRR